MKQKPDDIIRKHYKDLDERAFSRDYPCYTDFLDLNELSLLSRSKGSFRCRIACFGGYGPSERQVAGFLPSDAFLDAPFPVAALHVSPLHPRYAETLTHRDFLGSLMGLSIKRDLLGDVIVKKDTNSCYVFCLERIAGFICDNLTQVRQTEVTVEAVDLDGFDFSPDFRQEDIIVTSERADSVVAACAHLSRSAAGELLDSEKVYLNGRIVTSRKAPVREGDILTIRGKGKLKVFSFNGTTKKDRLKIKIGWYD